MDYFGTLRYFRFLVLLSYEKYHSKPIIDIPKILRLCEGLFASGQVAEKYILPALIPVAEDLFCNRTLSSSSSSTSSADLSNTSSDLEAQREVVLNMLLKLIVHSEALDMLIQIMAALKAEGEEKWRKISRTITDVLIPLLVNHKIALDNKATLDLLRNLLSSLSPGCLRPVDPLLAAVLTCAVDLSNLKVLSKFSILSKMGLAHSMTFTYISGGSEVAWLRCCGSAHSYQPKSRRRNLGSTGRAGNSDRKLSKLHGGQHALGNVHGELRQLHDRSAW